MSTKKFCRHLEKYLVRDRSIKPLTGKQFTWSASCTQVFGVKDCGFETERQAPKLASNIKGSIFLC